MIRTSAENVIIGSGAGGSTVFHHFASRFIDSLMIEEGSSQSPSDFDNADAATVFENQYRYGGAQPVFATSPFAFGEGRILGGTTELNGGLLWRTPEPLIREWRRGGVFSGLTTADLDAIFSSIEADLSVAPTPLSKTMDVPSQLLKQGAIKNGRRPVEAPRAGGQLCKRSNRCAIGCPVGAKQSMAVSLIPAATACGGRVMTGQRAVRFVSAGKVIKKVVLEDTVTKRKTEVSGQNFFLSAGPIQSPLLLSRSGGPKKYPIEFHLNAKVLVEFHDDVSPYNSTIFTHQVQSFLDQGIIYMATALSPHFAGLELAGFPTGVVNSYVEKPRRFGLFTVQVRAERRGSLVSLHDSPLLSQRLTAGDIKKIGFGVQRLSDDLFAVGAKSVWIPSTARDMCASPQQVADALSAVSRFDWKLSSVHAMASLPVTSDSRGLFMPDGRSRNFTNLWTTDAASLPSSIGESPQGSIMALTRANLVSRY